jgi:hypothetical protein
MRRYAATLVAIMIALSSIACSSKVASVGPVDPIVAREGRRFDLQRLPSMVSVTYTNGRVGQRKVTWDTSELELDQLYGDCTVWGTVEGTDIRATVIIDAQVGSVECLRLSTEEASAPDAAAAMREQIARSVFVDASLWSPDATVVALLLDDSVCIWRVRDRVPTRLPELARGLLYHDLGWSYDGAYLSVYAFPSSEARFITIAYPDLRVACRLDVVALGHWAPSSHEFLTSTRGDDSVASADLTVLDTDTGEARVVVRSENGVFLAPSGWDGPDAVIYDVYSELGLQQAKGVTIGIR